MARLVAAKRGMTLRQLVDAGLRHTLGEHKKVTKPFKLRSASFGGAGLASDVQGESWDHLRNVAYEGRGG